VLGLVWFQPVRFSWSPGKQQLRQHAAGGHAQDQGAAQGTFPRDKRFCRGTQSQSERGHPPRERETIRAGSTGRPVSPRLPTRSPPQLGSITGASSDASALHLRPSTRPPELGARDPLPTSHSRALGPSGGRGVPDGCRSIAAALARARP